VTSRGGRREVGGFEREGQVAGKTFRHSFSEIRHGVAAGALLYKVDGIISLYQNGNENC
jgi:hypothetical protein